jgi:hypothetical protein
VPAYLLERINQRYIVYDIFGTTKKLRFGVPSEVLKAGKMNKNEAVIIINTPITER